jgi:putative hydrolase of the HAD superfamily
MFPLIKIIREQSRELLPQETNIEPVLRHLPGIKCVIFDVYGTLMVSGVGDISHSSADDRSQAIISIFKEMDLPFRETLPEPGKTLNTLIQSHQETSRQKGIDYPEIDIREVWSDFIRQHTRIDPATAPAQTTIEALAIRFELKVNPTWPMPFLEKTLRSLRDYGIKLGIVSNAQFFTPLLFEAYHNQTPESLGFEKELCQWSYCFKEAKPSTRMYRINAMKLEAKYGIRANEVIYVGNDMLNDITPAYKSGFKTALFAGDQRSLRLREGDERIENIAPDLIIRSLDQLIDCI